MSEVGLRLTDDGHFIEEAEARLRIPRGEVLALAEAIRCALLTVTDANGLRVDLGVDQARMQARIRRAALTAVLGLVPDGLVVVEDAS